MGPRKTSTEDGGRHLRRLRRFPDSSPSTTTPQVRRSQHQALSPSVAESEWTNDPSTRSGIGGPRTSPNCPIRLLSLTNTRTRSLVGRVNVSQRVENELDPIARIGFG